MINFCQISPTAHLDDFCQYDGTHLILAHLVEEDETYANWYRDKCTSEKILDNSAFEMYKRGLPMYDSSKLIEMGKKVGADVIVMSDYPNEPGAKTIRAAEMLAPSFKENGFQTFFVPQSEKGNLCDYIEAVCWASESDLVDWIGISILGVPNAFGDIERENKLQRFLSRWKMMGILKEEGILDTIAQNGKKIHFLGALDGWAGEVELVKDYHGDIYSWDSSQCVWHGLNGITFDDSPTGLINGKFEEEVDFSFETTSERLIAAVHYNIEFLRHRGLTDIA